MAPRGIREYWSLPTVAFGKAELSAGRFGRPVQSALLLRGLGWVDEGLAAPLASEGNPAAGLV